MNQLKVLTLIQKRGFSLNGVSPHSLKLKHTVDILVSLSGLIVMSPVFAIIWIAIRLEDGGPAIFRQERVGYKGRIFVIYKFRSMRIDAEKDGEPQLSNKSDSRTTKVGKFLRDHHLDELPQLWNVIKGDMSFVGPRPERQYFVEQISAINPDYCLLYDLRPGLFSEATLYNGYTDTMDKMLERLRMDLEYRRKRNIWLDIRIIWLTITSILSGKKF